MADKTITAEPNYSNIFDIFHRDGKSFATRLSKITSDEDLEATRSFVHAVTMMAGCMTSMEQITHLRDLLDEATTTLSAESRRRQALQEWPVGHVVRVVEGEYKGRTGKIRSAAARDQNSVRVDVVVLGMLERFDPEELEYVGEE